MSQFPEELRKVVELLRAWRDSRSWPAAVREGIEGNLNKIETSMNKASAAAAAAAAAEVALKNADREKSDSLTAVEQTMQSLSWLFQSIMPLGPDRDFMRQYTQLQAYVGVMIKTWGRGGGDGRGGGGDGRGGGGGKRSKRRKSKRRRKSKKKKSKTRRRRR